MRFSGHETFPFRYAWLPKAYQGLSVAEDALADDEKAMESLGLGKNMINALRFWLEVTDIGKPTGGRCFRLTEFGRAILGTEGYDRFLEDIRTLWLLHWRIASQKEEPLFAWHLLFNHWHYPELCRSDILMKFQQEAQLQSRTLSSTTLAQHFEVFLKSYLPPTGRNADEDALDCPLAALELIERIGDRPSGSSNRPEPIYRFRREAKPDISPGLFVYCLNDFWIRHCGNEKTLSFKQISTAAWSPGQLLKLPEEDLRVRLERIEEDSEGVFKFRTSAAHPTVSRDSKRQQDLLPLVYEEALSDA